MTKPVTLLLAVATLVVGATRLSPAAPMRVDVADIDVDSIDQFNLTDNQVFTEVGFGRFVPPAGFGPPLPLLFGRSLLSPTVSSELAAAPLPGPDFAAAVLALPTTVDDFEFLTGDIGDFGKARDQYRAALQGALDQLRADNPGVTFLAPPLPADGEFGSTEFSVELFGGYLFDPDLPNVLTVVMGDGHVSLYAAPPFVVRAQQVSPVPEPGSLALWLLAGVGAVCHVRRRGRNARRGPPREGSPP